jgi:hypothetical protein
LVRTVIATPHDLLRAATGRPMDVVTDDGEGVLLRLATVDEVREQITAAREVLAEEGAAWVPPMPDDSTLRALVRPLPCVIGL